MFAKSGNGLTMFLSGLYGRMAKTILRVNMTLRAIVG